MRGDVLTGAFSLEGLAERIRKRKVRRERESLRSRKLLNSLRVFRKQTVKENKNDEEYYDEQLQNPCRSAPEP